MRYLRLIDNQSLAFREALTLLTKGGVFLFPTDTVYGFGGDATRRSVVERTRRLKGRSSRKPFPWLVADFSMAKRYGYFSPQAEQYARIAWPGAVTFVVRARERNRSTIALRVPAHSWLRRLIRRFGKPIIGTSANRSGQKPSVNARDAQLMLPEVDLVIDGGRCARKPSRVISWVGAESKTLR